MKTRYVLERIQKRLTSLKEGKKKIQKIKDENPYLFDAEKLLEKKRKTLYELCDKLEISGPTRIALTFIFTETLKEIFDYVPGFFKLQDKLFESLEKQDVLENKLVEMETLFWFYYGCVESNFTRIMINPDLYEMFMMIEPDLIVTDRTKGS